jgi:hypothetical protein
MKPGKRDIAAAQYPSDPMIGVRFDDGAAADFWSEELAAA